MPPVRVRRLRETDETALGVVVDRARAAGDLAGSALPRGERIVRFALEQADEVAVAEASQEGLLAGFVFPEAKALVVEPAFRRRGVGRALVEEAVSIARERRRPEVILGVLPDDTRGLGFLRAVGFDYHSTLWDLDLAPDRAISRPTWPDGHTARPFDRERDIPAWVALFNAAFADHATPLQLDEAALARSLAAEDAPPDDDILLVEDPTGRLAGFCATEPRRTPGGGVESRGEVWTIGVRPDAQGRGLGRQLLRWGVAYLRSLGVETVTLSVNGRNPRALGLYGSEGFRRTSTRERWARPVAAR